MIDVAETADPAKSPLTTLFIAPFLPRAFRCGPSRETYALILFVEAFHDKPDNENKIVSLARPITLPRRVVINGVAMPSN